MVAVLAAVLVLAAGPYVDPIGIDARTAKPFEPIALAADASGVTTIDLPAGRNAANYLLIAGSPDPSASEMKIRVNQGKTPAPMPLRTAVESVPESWRRDVAFRRQRMEIVRRLQKAAPDEHVAAKLAEERSFFLFVKEDDFRDIASYHEVHAKLVAVGTHCLVYVDNDDKPDSFDAAVIHEVVDTFDNRVYPQSRELFGQHRDIDRNGKFTILFTHWLSHLSDGKVSLGGFVRGGDFYPDIDAPFSNQCDMMYLNSNLRPGSHLRTLIAHEYTHAITFTEHVFGQYLPGEQGQDEEGWLNEAISHLAENLMGDSWTNLDYRISAFLTDPSRYRLVVGDYYRAGLWRCHGARGATYLFLRWCVDRYGEEILKELTQSNLMGVDNLEAATQTPFAELFRQWSIATCLDSMTQAEQLPGYQSIDLRGRLDRRLLVGPRTTRLNAGENELTLAPTGWMPIEIRCPARQTTRLKVSTDPKATLQLTLIRLPDSTPHVDLSVERVPEGESVRLRVSHHAGEVVTWESISWERAYLPQTKSRASKRRAQFAEAAEVFVNASSKPNVTINSDPLDTTLLAGEPIVFKLLGRDPSGRPVSASAIYTPQ